MQIPIAKPKFHSDDLDRIADSLARGWVGMGVHTNKFETQFAQFTHCDDAVSCSSGTSALHLALAAAKIGPGDEVIVPSFTWVSSVNSIIFQGATPVLCDIDLDTYAMNTRSLKSAITSKTKAIMPVHLFGCAAPMDKILSIARSHQLVVIEDAACALGTWYGSRHAGTLGDYGTFSFHPRKTITTGEGGMVLAKSTGDFESVRALRNHGITPKGAVSMMGYNYRLSDLQGAIGVGQMALLNEFLSARRRIANRYAEALSDRDDIVLPTTPPNTVHPYQAYVCRLVTEDATARDRLMSKLAERGVQTRPGTHAVHTLDWHGVHLGFEETRLINSTLAHQNTIALPIFPELKNTEQDFVIEQLADCLRTL